MGAERRREAAVELRLALLRCGTARGGGSGVRPCGHGAEGVRLERCFGGYADKWSVRRAIKRQPNAIVRLNARCSCRIYEEGKKGVPERPCLFEVKLWAGITPQVPARCSQRCSRGRQERRVGGKRCFSKRPSGGQREAARQIRDSFTLSHGCELCSVCKHSSRTKLKIEVTKRCF